MSENKSKLVIAILHISEKRSITALERFAASERRLCLRLHGKLTLYGKQSNWICSKTLYSECFLLSLHSRVDFMLFYQFSVEEIDVQKCSMLDKPVYIRIIYSTLV